MIHQKNVRKITAAEEELENTDVVDMSDEENLSDVQKMILYPEKNEPAKSDIVNRNTMDQNMKMVDYIFQGLSKEGRGILKHIEDFNYKLEKSLAMIENQDEIYKKLEQKKIILDSVSSQIYGLVFDLENFDIVPVYNNEQMSSAPMPNITENESQEDKEEELEQKNVEDTENTEEKSEDNAEEEETGGGEPIPQGGFEETEGKAEEEEPEHEESAGEEE